MTWQCMPGDRFLRKHPFYAAQKGFIKAEKLRAGNILCTVHGEYVIVEQVQHEILEPPVTVYNFRVAENHTYYKGRDLLQNQLF